MHALVHSGFSAQRMDARFQAAAVIAASANHEGQWFENEKGRRKLIRPALDAGVAAINAGLRCCQAGCGDKYHSWRDFRVARNPAPAPLLFDLCLDQPDRLRVAVPV